MCFACKNRGFQCNGAVWAQLLQPKSFYLKDFSNDCRINDGTKTTSSSHIENMYLCTDKQSGMKQRFTYSIPACVRMVSEQS